MVEGQRLEEDRRRPLGRGRARQKSFEDHMGVAHRPEGSTLRSHTARPRRASTRRHASEQAVDSARRVEPLAAVPVAVTDEEDARLDLPKRSSTAAVPKSGELDDKTAPIDAVASIAMIVSGTLGRSAATRSPAARLARGGPPRASPPPRRSSPQVSSRRAPDSPRKTIATSSDARPRPASRFSAKLRRASGNQLVAVRSPRGSPGMRSAPPARRCRAAAPPLRSGPTPLPRIDRGARSRAVQRPVVDEAGPGALEPLPKRFSSAAATRSGVRGPEQLA